MSIHDLLSENYITFNDSLNHQIILRNMAVVRARITVLFPVHRIDSFIEEAVTSIFVQDCPDYEVFFLVDGYCLQDFEASISRVECSMSSPLPPYLILPFNSINHLSHKLNVGISLVSSDTEFIARMDSDDVSHASRLRLQLEFLLNEPSCGVVGCKVQLVDKNSAIINRIIYPFVQSDALIRRALPYKNLMCHPALMFRRSALIEVNGYTYGGRSEDHDLLIRIMLNTAYTFYNLPLTLFSYRRHETQITAFKNAIILYSDIASFCLKYFILTSNLAFLLPLLIYIPLFRRVRKFMNNLFSC